MPDREIVIAELKFNIHETHLEEASYFVRLSRDFHRMCCLAAKPRKTIGSADAIAFNVYKLSYLNIGA